MKFCKKYFVYILIAFLGAMLFFVNVKDSHDWGGDFAMYIIQAKNIAQGNPQYSNYYLYNTDYQVLGPPAYPAGFPLLLAPVYALFGNSIKAFTVFISLILFLFGILLVAFYRRYFPGLIPFFLAMLILFNPWTLMFKLEVMSDIPFAFFFLLGTYVYLNRIKHDWVFIITMGLLAGFLISIRTIGYTLALSILVYSAIQAWKHKKWRSLVEGSIIFVVAAVFNFLLNRIIFPIPVAEGLSYIGIFGIEPLWKTLSSNLSYYLGILEYFFTPYTNHWKWAAVIMHALALAFIVLGFINHIIKKFNFIDVLVILYLGVILIYPYRHAGFRFLLPVIPYLLYYMILGMQSFKFDFKLKPDVKVAVIGILALLLYMNTFLHIVSERNKVIPGPQEEASVEAFEYIRNNTPPDARMLFFKPRVLGLYTSRMSFANKPGQDITIIDKKIEETGIDYILIHREYSDPSIKQYVLSDPDMVSLIWQNEKFQFYQRNH